MVLFLIWLLSNQKRQIENKQYSGERLNRRNDLAAVHHFFFNGSSK